MAMKENSLITRNVETLNKFKVTIASTFLSLLLMSPFSQAQTLPPSLLEKFNAIKEKTNIGAVSYALVEGDQIVAIGGLGQKSIEDSTPVTADSVIRVGSITKTFTALAMMKLVEQDKLRLNQTVKSVLPNVPYQNPYPDSPATLAMMLEHTSGLTDFTGKEFNYPIALSLKKAFQVAPEARVARWPPGYHKSYTNVGAGYISAAAEKVTNEDYDLWFNKNILHAMGMKNSQLHWSDEIQKELVAGYDSDLKTRIPYWHTLFRAFGNLNTTARDMSRFLLLMVNQGVLDNKPFIQASSILRMETPKTTLGAKQGLSLGYGLGIRAELLNGHRIYQHGGDADGYISHFGYSKESKRGYIVVINAYKHSILRQFTSALKNWLIEDLKKPDSPLIADISTEHLKTLEGVYHQTAHRFAPQTKSFIKVKLDNNKLVSVSSHGNLERTLIPVSKWLYRYKNDPEATIAFIRTPNGDIHLQNGKSSFLMKAKH
jgi:CubicO group peptidase (beta-lactamase class C family)